MKILITSLLFVAGTLQGQADSEKFSRDRAAILAMVGKFEVEFNFTETVALAPGYQLKKPYTSKAHELVKIAEDNGPDITLQHLLVVDDGTGLSVIKHWAQIWKYEDSRTLNYEGKKVWLPVTHSAEATKGTWTQLVTQTDDSPRYKAQGKWSHAGNSSTWTSQVSTRPMPRRDHSTRNDYDLLVVINQHIITPDGWVHQQTNRKLVSREGKNQFLCVEAGLNHYRRILGEEAKAGFKIAEEQWDKTHKFWRGVRDFWTEVITESDKPISYAARVEGQRLMSGINDLADKVEDGEEIEAGAVEKLINKFLR